MRIRHKRQTYVVSNKHPLIEAILVLARAGAAGSVDATATPERNDVKRLWPSLRRPQRRFLGIVAEHPAGISQADVLKRMKIEPNDLRGLHNGLARICDGLGIEKPVSTTGYNAENRVYRVSPDVAKTVLRLMAKDEE